MKITKKFMSDAIRENYNKHGIYDISDIERVHIGHFFDKGAMRFFNSKIINEVFPGTKNVYFVTSEKFDSRSSKLFTVRRLNLSTKGIDTVGEFQEFDSRAKALTEALRCAFIEQ